MKRLTLTLALAMLAGTWASAESSVWRVQKGTSTVYIAGTCHILRQADYPLPDEFDMAYKASDTIVFETDIAALSDPATARKMIAKMSYTDGSSIDTHLSPKAYALLSAYCASNGVPLAAFKKLKPAMLMPLLSLAALSKLGASQEGVDVYYHRKATSDNKVVGELETVDEQIGYVATMADGNEDAFVIQSLNDMATLKKEFDSLLAAWRKGDGDKIDHLMLKDMKKQMPQLYKRLLTDRNSNWLPRIEALYKTPGTEFVLVGVAHLVGPDGLLEAMRKKGYKVEKL